ncbi:glycosyltransferase family 4 protein [Bacteroides eggerthii]|jgi:glycosyltransferase involved in cell wall biosynthesis|uniref:glycosyltransferase family 4 protein n=1 Tax=Bacteroides eggerthii TaxID=28111 RepID=UPI002FD984F4
MRILVDITPCEWRSLWIYACRILRVWKSNNQADIPIRLLIKANMEDYVKSEFPEFEYIVFRPYEYRNKFQQLFKYKCFLVGKQWKKTINAQHDCDIVISLGIETSCFWKIKIPKIQVVHDLYPLRVWKGSARFLYRLFVPYILRHSAGIIAITKYVKQDLLQTYPFLSADKITVIHNGVPLPSVDGGENQRMDYSYLLYISTLYEYKNVGTLVKAFIKLKDAIPHKLVIVGKTTPYWEDIVLPLIRQAGIEDRIVHLSHYVSDEDIVRLYRSAAILISPSLHEGFGYTPIEAAICKTPVICTKETALPEVTMGLVNYYEPSLDSEALKNAILEVLNNYPSEKRLQTISDTFKESYDNTRQAMKIYEYVVGYARKS